MIEKLIVQLKREYASWGAPKIRERLQQRYPEVACPPISTVHAVLDRHGLVNRRYCNPLTTTDCAIQYLIRCEALASTKAPLGCARASGPRPRGLTAEVFGPSLDEVPF